MSDPRQQLRNPPASLDSIILRLVASVRQSVGLEVTYAHRGSYLMPDLTGQVKHFVDLKVRRNKEGAILRWAEFCATVTLDKYLAHTESAWDLRLLQSYECFGESTAAKVAEVAHIELSWLFPTRKAYDAGGAPGRKSYGAANLEKLDAVVTAFCALYKDRTWNTPLDSFQGTPMKTVDIEREVGKLSEGLRLQEPVRLEASDKSIFSKPMRERMAGLNVNLPPVVHRLTLEDKQDDSEIFVVTGSQIRI